MSSPSRSVNRDHQHDERDPRHLGDGRQEGVRYHGIDDKGSQKVEHGHDGGYGEYEVTDSRGGFSGFGGGRFGGRRASGGRGFYRPYRGGDGGGAWVDRGGRGWHGGRGGRGNGHGFRGQQSGVHHGQQHGGYRGQQHGEHRGQQHGGHHGQQHGGHRGQQYEGRGGIGRGSHRGGGMDKADSLRESISSLEAIVKKHDGSSDSLVSIKDSIVALQIELKTELEVKAKEEDEAIVDPMKQLCDKVALLERDLALEKSRSKLKQNTLDSTLSLISKNKKLESDIDRIKSAKRGSDINGEELMKVKEELVDAHEELDNLRVELEETKAGITNDDADEESGKDVLDGVKAELYDVKADLDDVKAELDDVKAELYDAKAELDDSKAEIEDAKAELDGTLERETKLVSHITKLMEGAACVQCSGLEKSLNDCKLTIYNLELENEEGVKHVEESNNLMAEMKVKIKKQTDQVKTLSEAMDKLNVERDVDEAKGDDTKLNDDDRSEYEALKRRLGSAEFNYMSASCIEDIIGKMEAATKELYDAFGDKAFDEAEKLKFVLGISHSLIPAAKHVMFKHLLTSDTAVQRGCVGVFLNKLIKSDRINKLLVKSTNETTPVNPMKALNSLCKKTIIPDMSLMGGKYDQFFNANNGGCKIINFGNVVLVAFTRSSHMLKKHEPFMDVNNKPSQAKCPIQSCKAPYIGGSTVLAPMTIAGPESYGGLGFRIWVCEKHWQQSLEDASDDDFCEAAGLDHEVKLLEENSGLVARKRKRLSLNKKSRKRLPLDQEIKHAEKTKTKEDNTADMFLDSSEEIGPSDKE